MTYAVPIRPDTQLVEVTARSIFEAVWAQCASMGILHARFGLNPRWEMLLEIERQDYRDIAIKVITDVRHAREDGRL